MVWKCCTCNGVEARFDYLGIGVCVGFGGAKPFNYFCYGAALSEVELDTLTGDWHLLRTDLAMDVGDSLNPAIDIGQVREPALGLGTSLCATCTCLGPDK